MHYAQLQAATEYQYCNHYQLWEVHYIHSLLRRRNSCWFNNVPVASVTVCLVNAVLSFETFLSFLMYVVCCHHHKAADEPVIKSQAVLAQFKHSCF